ncbi:transposase [Mesobacillus foraminis]|uniref:transposase n=1 Tax=Mesobacillus foraminis TaxID=279826 RepID=UPI0039A2D00D
MEFLLISGSIISPVLLFILRRKWPGSRLYLNGLAVFSALVFGNIASLAIHEIIEDKTVFMTNIHGLFLNPFFLVTGVYLGVYFLYRMLIWTIEELGRP